MNKRWIEALAILGCALMTLSIGLNVTKAQDRGTQYDYPQAKNLNQVGPAIHVLVTEPASRRDLRKLVTKSRTAREHPDLAQYYESKTLRLRAEAKECQTIAHRFGDPRPLDAPDHFNIGRNARHYHVIAKRYLRKSQDASLLAALYTQAEQGEGCFSCHSLHGHGGKVGPDLAVEGSRDRSNAWLIGHFKNPQAYSPATVMPGFGGLTDRELQTLATFLKYQKRR